MTYTTTAVSLGRTKEAALYFDRVVPIFAAFETGIITGQLDPWPRTLTESLLPFPLEGTPIGDAFLNLNLLAAEAIRGTALQRANALGQPISPAFLSKATADYKAFEDGLIDFLDRNSLWRSHFVARIRVGPGSTATASDIAIAVSNLLLVDIEAVTWDQLAAIRSDSVAMSKLRRLRLYASQRYEGQGIAFLADDLALRLEEYQETARRWGLATRLSTLSMLVNSKALMATAGSALIAFAAGSPATAAAAATGGAAIELGRVAVEVARRRNELRDLLADSPMSYIDYVDHALRTDA